MKKQTKKYLVKKQSEPIQSKPVKTLEVSNSAVTKGSAPVLPSTVPTTSKTSNKSQSFQAGDVLTRHFKGSDIKVKVIEEGFVYEGKEYKSLSAVAIAITGYPVSGPAFFRVK